MLVRTRLIGQQVRAAEPGEPDLADNGLLDLDPRDGHCDDVRRIGGAKLDHAAIVRGANDAHALPSAIPDLEQADAGLINVAPLLLLYRPPALHVVGHGQVGTRAAVGGEGVEVQPSPARPGARQ